MGTRPSVSHNLNMSENTLKDGSEKQHVTRVKTISHSVDENQDSILSRH